MPVRDIKIYLLDLHVGAIFYDMEILFLKLCILIQFLRIFIPTGERSRTFWSTHILIWVNTIFYVTIAFLEIFACKPMAKLWDPLITNGKCLNTPVEYLICASFNSALDLLILIWTQKVIWSLHMSAARKLKLAVLFTAGLMACVFSGIRAYMNVRLLRTEDEAYIGALMGLYTFPETTSGFLVLCLPVLPKFYEAMKKKMFPPTPAAASSSEIPSQEKERKERKPPRSWWHVSFDFKTDSKTSKISEETTAITEGAQSAMPLTVLEAGDGEGKDRSHVEFLSFESPELNFRLDCENHRH